VKVVLGVNGWTLQVRKLKGKKGDAGWPLIDMYFEVSFLLGMNCAEIGSCHAP
jgi:hypothetical protein